MKELNKYLGDKNVISLNPYNVFVVVKPEFIKKNREIMSLFLDDDEYTVSKYMCKRLNYDEATDLYRVHENESFFEDLCKYMSSGLSIGYCLNYTGNDDPVKHTEKIKEVIRKTFGKDEMKNALHSSDSPENVYRESKIYFK